MIWDLASSSFISEEFGSSSIAYWSVTNTKVHVLVDGSSPRMLVLSAENLDPIYVTKLFHQANDMIVIENDKEIVESLVVATGTGNAAHYIRDFDRPVTSEVDTDRDGISNIEDLDADGDGIYSTTISGKSSISIFSSGIALILNLISSFSSQYLLDSK